MEGPSLLVLVAALLFLVPNSSAHDTRPFAVPSQIPPPLFAGAAAWDAALGRMVLFSGEPSSGQDVSATWEYGTSGWTNVTGSTAPTPRDSAAMAYDPPGGYLLLFGGEDSRGHHLSDTWTIQNGTWTNRTTTVHPPPSISPVMAYDAVDGYVVLYGMFPNATGDSVPETWTFVSGAWSRLQASLLPPARYYSSLAYDPSDGYVVLFGGISPSGVQDLSDTWVFDHGGWSELPAPTYPPARSGPNLAYDATDGTLILFGGNAIGYMIELGDTWSFKAGAWTELHPPASPPGRSSGQLAGGDTSAGVIMYGGTNATGQVYGDLWGYRAGSWSNLTAPPGAGSAAHTWTPSETLVTILWGRPLSVSLSSFCRDGRSRGDWNPATAPRISLRA